ncbi:MAG: hypothetical protein RLZZ04_2242 [Cyanobacteriota bacterium]|jgi:predicted metal-dependent HD superfamily phosphohydrolase
MVNNSHQHPNIRISQLKSSWFDLLSESSAALDFGNQIFVDLVNGYSNPVRHYHNLEHIERILSLLEEAKDTLSNPHELKFSAWFHDYIYHPQAKDNEIKSAAYAKKVLRKLNIDPETIQSVTQIILSTQNHQPLRAGIDNLIFLDVDLAILGTTPDQYLQYAQGIRKEYDYLSDRDYQQGRTKVLTQFFARNRIYYTEYFYQRLECSARNNLQTEINHLSCSQIN